MLGFFATPKDRLATFEVTQVPWPTSSLSLFGSSGRKSQRMRRFTNS